jgi:DNA-binding NarL/FixJ family response regulator
MRERWQEAFDLACQGYSNKAIAQRMGITEQTVKNHLYRAYKLMYAHLTDRNPRAWSSYHRGYLDALKVVQK